MEKTIIHPYKIPKHFDWTKSTSDNYNTGQAGKFVGAFTKIRKTMDYSYHAIYPAERQRWQDEVIKSVVYGNFDIVMVNFSRSATPPLLVV